MKSIMLLSSLLLAYSFASRPPQAMLQSITISDEDIWGQWEVISVDDGAVFLEGSPLKDALGKVYLFFQEDGGLRTVIYHHQEREELRGEFSVMKNQIMVVEDYIAAPHPNILEVISYQKEEMKVRNQDEKGSVTMGLKRIE